MNQVAQKLEELALALGARGAAASWASVAVLREALGEIARLEQWVTDLQAGQTVNCVYCGHRYGPDADTPVALAEILKQHIEQCPKHPLSLARQEIARLQKDLARMQRCYGLPLPELLVCPGCGNKEWDSTLPCEKCGHEVDRSEP